MPAAGSPPESRGRHWCSRRSYARETTRVGTPMRSPSQRCSSRSSKSAAHDARARGPGRLLGPLLEALQEARSALRRAARRRRSARVPQLRHEALAHREGAANVLPRSEAHDRDAAPSRARRCSPRAARASTSPLEDDDVDLRAPRRRESTRGDQQAPAVAVCCILAARTEVHARRNATLALDHSENQELAVDKFLFDERILAEYAEVLARPRFALDPADVAEVARQLEADGERPRPTSYSLIPRRYPRAQTKRLSSRTRTPRGSIGSSLAEPPWRAPIGGCLPWTATPRRGRSPAVPPLIRAGMGKAPGVIQPSESGTVVPS